MLKRAIVVVIVGMLSFSGLAAQQQQKPSAPVVEGAQVAPHPTPAAAPRREPQQMNVRFELTITDQTGPGEPSRKVVTMVVADQHLSSIRTSGWIQTLQGRREVSINVDVRPVILRDNAVRIELGVQYQPTGGAGSPVRAVDSTQGAQEAWQTMLNERISTILESAKPVVISQAADAASDRRISVEAKATIVK